MPKFLFLLVFCLCATAVLFHVSRRPVPSQTAFAPVPRTVPLTLPEPKRKSSKPPLRIKPGGMVPYAWSAWRDLPNRWVVHRGKPLNLSNVIERYARMHNLDPLLVMLIIKQESAFHVRARSSVGAGGLMQLMPGTAADLGCRDVFDPHQNVEAGVRYFAWLYRRYGTVNKALAAYNAGPGNVDRYGGVPPFRETKHYVEVIGGRYKQLRRLSG